MALDLLGFEQVVPDLAIRLKQGGIAKLGEPGIMRPNQAKFLKYVRDKRIAQQPVQVIELKCRQFVSMSTTVGAVITGDMQVNAGLNGIVTAHIDKSLEEISQIYRYFYGRTKTEGVKQGRAERLADRLFVAKSGSRIVLQLADEDLGRSGSITHLHVSEAGYIENLQEALRSIDPAVSDAWWRFIVLETTLRRNGSTELLDFIAEVEAKKLPPWEVNFTAWHANPDLKVVMGSKELAEFQETAPIYERELVHKHKLSWAQARWYFDRRVGGLMLGSYEAMAEAYPTSKDELLKSVAGGAFFRQESMEFYRDNIRAPIKRLKFTPQGFRMFEPGESPLQAHLALWDIPTYGMDYRIGADCADEDEREAVEGSQNALVIIDQTTGTMIGEWHGDCNAHEFAKILDAAGRMFNEAELVIEFNNAGRAVTDHLRSVTFYPNLYRREKFKHGAFDGFATGMTGFDTRGNTRPLLLDRIQMGVNGRMFVIPSQYVFDCLKGMAKRRGQKAKMGENRNVEPDDGAIALGLTCFGHDYMTGKQWSPKQAYAEPLLDPAPKRIPGAIRVEREPERGTRFDPVWNCWR